MDKRSFALMAVLYDTQEGDLYHDIYFPIIKYGIATLSSNQQNTEKYYKLNDLQFAIQSQFGIPIPLIVLKQSVLAVSKSNHDITLSVLEKGSLFQIKKSWDISKDKSLEINLSNVLLSFDDLESEFRQYLEKELLSTEKTFLDFFSDNTRDIFKYLDQLESIPEINENYIHISKFLLELKESKSELFNIANSIFWGSVVSAFLERETDLEIKPLTKVAYYLDSSLVMALLDLDNEANVSYSREMVEIIKSSGNSVHVHPMTLREVNSILFSVEKSQLPHPNTSIESAYYRRSLTPTLILKIRNDLKNIIDGFGVILDLVPETELDEIQLKYKNNPRVRDLKQLRGYTNSDSLRDIHDVFISDFVTKKRGDVAVREKLNSFFVSLNIDLIDFLRPNLNTQFATIIHPSKIVTELWIHNSKCTILKKNGLTEIMSRCIALNNTDVRRKLRLITKYFDESTFTEATYLALYHALINRSKHVLEEVSKIEEEQSSELKESSKRHFQVAIRISLEEESKKSVSLLSVQNQLDEVCKNFEIAKLEIESGKSQIEISKTAVVEKVLENEKLIQSSESQEKAISEIGKKIAIQEEIIVLYNRIHNINVDLPILKNYLITIEDERGKSIKMYKFYIPLFFEIIGLLFLLLSLVCLFSFADYSNTFSEFYNSLKLPVKLFAIAGIAISIVIGAVKGQNLFVLSPIIHYHKIRKEQMQFWDENHEFYFKEKNRCSDLEKELRMKVEQIRKYEVRS